MSAAPFIVGFRFRKSQRRPLEALVERCRSERLAQPLTLFRAALEATREGEPLRVECTSRLEAHLLARAFVDYGIVEPTIEEVPQ